jgi:hypothetical protein
MQAYGSALRHVCVRFGAGGGGRALVGLVRETRREPAQRTGALT